MLGGAKYCSYIHGIIKVMRNQKNEQEKYYESLLTEEDRISIEYIMWHAWCDRGTAEELYRMDGKSLKNYKINKDVWDSIKY